MNSPEMILEARHKRRTFISTSLEEEKISTLVPEPVNRPEMIEKLGPRDHGAS